MKKWTLYLLAVITCGLGVYYYYPESKLPIGIKVEKLVVIKSKQVLHVYSEGRILKSYPIAIGQNPIGDKEYEGDKRTPEGEYYITGKNPNSGYYKNLGISYPNERDIADARRRNVSPGGEIKIHGLKNGQGFIGKFHRWRNWTAGCIALTNEEVEELYNNVEIGTPIIIKP